MTTSSIHTIIKFVIWSVACVMAVTAWMSPIAPDKNHRVLSCNHHIRSCPQRNSNIHNPCREDTWLRVLSQDVSESLHRESTEDGDKKVSYVIERGDGSAGGGGLPMPQRRRVSSENQGDEEEDEEEELRRPKVSAEMPLG